MAGSCLSPADYPQVWQRPSFKELVACLKDLHFKPPIWNANTSNKIIQESYENSARHRREIASYLSSIASSNLGWLQDDEQREIIWDEASRCLAERCGRAGMGEITRRWPFHERQMPFELIVREPPITGDALGHKTWGSSYLMAQQLDSIASGYLSHLWGPRCLASLSVLELGSGTGLLGMAAAVMWQANVVLSDLPDIMANLNFNIGTNKDMIEQLGGGVSSGTLTWGSKDGTDVRFSRKNQFDVRVSTSETICTNIS